MRASRSRSQEATVRASSRVRGAGSHQGRGARAGRGGRAPGCGTRPGSDPVGCRAGWRRPRREVAPSCPAVSRRVGCVLGRRGQSGLVGRRWAQVGQDRLRGRTAAGEGRPRPGEGARRGRRPPRAGRGSPRPPRVRRPRPRSRRIRRRSARTGPAGSRTGRAALLGRAPPVAGAEEQGAGAGERDVAEAEFLGVLVVLHGLVEGLHAPGVPGLDVGQRVGVAAQFVRQDLALGGPLLAALVAGEGAGDQSGDRDDVPLQALGLVGGEHLDGVLAARAGRCPGPSRTGRPCAGSRGRRAGWPRCPWRRRTRRCRGSWTGSRGGGRPGRAGTRRAPPPGR